MTDANTGPINDTTYPVRFASPRRDSVIHAESHAKGVIGWKKDLPDGEVASRELLVWSGLVVVVTSTTVAVHGKDGGRLWARTRRPSSPVAIANGNVYMETTTHFLQAVGIGNEPTLEDAPFPGVGSDENFVQMLWPRKDDFIVASTMPDPKFDSEGDAPPPKPKLSGRRVTYGDRMGDWGRDYEGTLSLPPLFIPEKARWMGSVDKVISVNVDTGDEKTFVLPLERSLDWSADPAGLIAVLGVHDHKKALLAVDTEGVEKWRYLDDGRADSWAKGQPPIGAASGRVVALTTERVLAFDAGKLAWQFDFHTDAPRRASLLADGSLLVTSKRMLRKLDASGKERFALELPGEIVTAPVVDAAGTIYVATASQLVAIH